MTPDSWARIEELYHAARELQPAQRAAFLSEACPSDAEVRQEVESLLAHEGEADRLLEGPAWVGDHSSPAHGTRESVAPALAAGSEFGIYRISERLGSGGMGEVYRAVDSRLHREVAIKVLPAAYSREPERLFRFQREARTLALLNHPHIGAIYGLEESGGICALVMELVEGPTLADSMARGPIPLAESFAIARQIAEALDYAHEKGVVHRDLKPANVKISPEGVVKVLDFGLAKASQEMTDLQSPLPSTEAGLILGTPAYMAPEQARGEKVDRRADIWAFGVILWEMLTGRQLFAGTTTSDTLAAVLTREPDFNAVPVDVRRLLRLCLARDTRQRLSQVSAALVLLEERESLPTRVARPATRWVWPAASFLVLLAGALSFVHYRETRPDPLMIRFQLTLPEKVTFGGHISVSPDGLHIAFSGRGPDGKTPIWIHDVDKPDSRPLAGTENGGFFFWSPDSRYLAFSVDRRLKKVNLAGGPPQTLCYTNGFALGGTWRADGTILFGSPDGPLLRVPESGDTPVPITRLDGSTDFNHAFPVFLPDGRHILYHMLSSAREGNAVYVTSFRPDGLLERGKQVALSQTGPQYVPGAHGKGRLLLLRGRTLVAQEFDETRLETVGDAYPVMDRVDSVMTLPYFGSSQNGTLAWWSGSSDTTSLVWFDRHGNRMGSPVQGQFGELALSPDGERAAVSESQGDAGKRDVRIIDQRLSPLLRVTFDPRDVGSPVWSPDGTQIAYGSDNLTEIRVVQASAAGRGENLPLAPGIKWPVDWSHDGRYLLYYSSTPATQGDLWVFPIGPHEVDRKPFPYLNTAYRESQGRFSPDGRYVAYVSTETGRPEVYVQPFPAAGKKSLVSTSGGFQPRWGKDGKELFYLDLTRVLMSAAVTTKPEFRHWEARALFDTHESIRIRLDFVGYDVSPDGQRFLVNTGDPVASASEINVFLNWQLVKR